VKQLLKHDNPDFITPDLWPPNCPDLNPVDYRICGVLQERVYRKSVKNWTLMNWSGFWLKCGLASSKVSLIRGLTTHSRDQAA